MKSFRVKLKSVTPYMQHRMDDKTLSEWEKMRGNIIERPDVDHTDLVNAEFRCYRNRDGRCFIPSEQIRRCLIEAGGYVKSKVGTKTKSMKSIVAATFMIVPEEIIVPDYDQIDKRSVVNKNVKARVMSIRPKWTSWEVEFTLEVWEPTITLETVKKIFENAGMYVGIGSFRPTANGLFGRFELVSCEAVRASTEIAA